MRVKGGYENEVEEMRGRNVRMNYFFNNSREGLIFHINGRITDVNPALAEMVGVTIDDLVDRDIFQWVTPQFHNLVKQNIVGGGGENEYEISLLHKSGDEIPVYIRHVQESVDGHDERLVAIQEIQALKQAQQEWRRIEDKLDELSNFDPYTGLPNRQLFNRVVAKMCERHREDQQRFAVVHITLNRMKMFNEIFGRNAGDRLIHQWATRLGHGPRKPQPQHSARIGGISFALALPYIEGPEAVIRMLHNFRAELEASFLIGDIQIDHFPCSYGVSFFPDDGDDVETLMSRAEIASRHSKGSDGERIHCFSQKMNVHTLEKFKFEKRLKGALDRDELALYYQPKVDTVTEQVVGYEALIRWIDPEHGLISPGEFIPVAEESGLIVPIGEWVIWSACEQLAALQNRSGDPLKISVNLSSIQFKQSNLALVVQQAITLHEIDPAQLDLELTESMVMGDVESSIGILNSLKALGVSLSIDDFGTGYSSLSYLKRFPIDTLKIDRSFVMDITTNSQDESITRAIIALAKSLELDTVAEGVETRKQLRLLSELGCDQIQGFLFGRPLPVEDVFGITLKT